MGSISLDGRSRGSTPPLSLSPSSESHASHHPPVAVIQENLGITCVVSELATEMIRGVRTHLPSFIKALRPGDLERAQLGLAHSYSRSKVRPNVNPNPLGLARS
jgi:nucleolar protein 56